jgi:Protein of unknown function (DUF3489)
MPGRAVRRRQFRKDGQRSAMKTFYIHANKVVVPQSRGRISLPEGAEKFGTERELAKLSAKWTVARLNEIWNALPGTSPVSKFTDRKTAVRRIWNQIQNLEPVPNPRKHAATKSDQILALLRQPSGATLQSITKATGWQAHSVRGFISGHLVKKMGLRVKSFRRDGERVYAIKS